MFKTIKNRGSGVIHAAAYYPEIEAPSSLCGTIGPYFPNFDVGRYERESMRNSTVTCKNCRTILGLLGGRGPNKPWKAKSIFDTIATNKSSGIAHAVWNGRTTECGLVDKPFRGHILSGHNNRAVFERSITCKNCRKAMGIGPLPPKKAKWVATFLGDIDVSKMDLHRWLWDDLEFEMSVCKEDYTDGRESTGWDDLHKKIVIFDNEGFVVESEDDLKWMKSVVEAMVEGLNTKGL